MPLSFNFDEDVLERMRLAPFGGLPLSLGRNSALKTVGMAVQTLSEQELRISPLTSKGEVGRCYVGMPVEEIPQLFAALAEAYLAIHPGRLHDLHGAIEAASHVIPNRIDDEDVDAVAGIGMGR